MYVQKVDFGYCPVISRYDTRLHYNVTVIKCTVIFRYV